MVHTLDVVVEYVARFTSLRYIIISCRHACCKQLYTWYVL